MRITLVFLWDFVRHRATLVMLYVFNSLKATGSLESLDYEMDWTHVYLFLFSAHLYNSIRNDYYYYYLFFAIISWYTAFLFHNIQYTLQAYIQNSGKSLFIMLCVIYYFFRMKKLIILLCFCSVYYMLLDFYMCHCKLNHYRSSPSKPTMPWMLLLSFLIGILI